MDILEKIKEFLLPELEGIKKEVSHVKELLEITNKRIDSIEVQIADLSRRIDASREELTAKIENVREELTAKIENVREELKQDIARLDAKVDRGKSELTTKIEDIRDELIERIENTRVELSQEIQAQSQRIDNIAMNMLPKERAERLEMRVERLERDVLDIKLKAG